MTIISVHIQYNELNQEIIIEFIQLKSRRFMGNYNKSRLPISLLVIILTSCHMGKSNVDKLGATVISVPIDDHINTEIDFINAIDSIRFVVLKDNTIEAVSKIVTYDSSYYILDKMQNSVGVYDDDGNLKYKLLKRGRSQQEYLEISDLSVSNQNITIFDQSLMKVINYDRKTGEYLNSFEVQDIYSNICQTDDGILVAYSSYGLQNCTNNMLTVYHSNKISNYINKPAYLNERINIEQSSPISRYMNQIYLTPLFSSIVYGIKSDSVMAKYYIDFGNHQIPDKFYKKLDNGNPNPMLKEIYQSDYAHSIDYFIETEDYIYFIFAYNKDDYSVYYKKETAEVSLYRKTSFGNDIQIWACNNHLSNTKTEFISLLYLTNIPREVNNADSAMEKLIHVVQEANEEYEFAIAAYKFK